MFIILIHSVEYKRVDIIAEIVIVIIIVIFTVVRSGGILGYVSSFIIRRYEDLKLILIVQVIGIDYYVRMAVSGYIMRLLRL